MSKVIIPNNTDNYISRVDERKTQFRKSYLYLGSLQATHPLLLKQYRIAAILTVGAGLQIQYPPSVAHKIIFIEDNPFQNISQYFSECNEWIAKNLQKGNILVHCRAGISRSASIVAAYIMKRKKVKLAQALEIIKESRSRIKPNQGFIAQLKEYQRKIAKSLALKNQKLK